MEYNSSSVAYFDYVDCAHFSTFEVCRTVERIVNILLRNRHIHVYLEEMQNIIEQFNKYDDREDAIEVEDEVEGEVEVEVEDEVDEEIEQQPERHPSSSQDQQPRRHPSSSQEQQPGRHPSSSQDQQPGRHPSSSQEQQPGRHPSSSLSPPTVVRWMCNASSSQQSTISNPPNQESQASTRE
ncbi:hypothetical protein V6N11_036665 [Hibiscus sabdariffa]|uniref:Uncharacterized protein n=1 Tax=Hibiscus sabdariffa TaxID=183260 RepID=A0ABR2RB16_9ROSI